MVAAEPPAAPAVRPDDFKGADAMSAIEEPTQARVQRDFAVTADIDDHRGVVRPHGELDVATVPAVERAALDVWSDGADALVLDLSAVTFFDSSGLQLLIRLKSLADDVAPRRLALADCSEPVRRVLELTRLADRFGLSQLPAA